MGHNMKKISNLQFILLLMTSIGLKNHVIVIPPLLRVAGRDAWISVILVLGSILIWGIIVFYIYKTINGEHIHTWLENTTGKIFKNILLWTVCFYLVIMAGVTLKETILWTNVSYLLETPMIVVTILFIIPCMLAALTNLRTIIIVNFFFLMFVILFGFFVAFTNIQFKDYSLLLPILEHGYPRVFKAMVYQGTGMVELITILFLQHQFQSKFRYWHYIIIAVILTFLTLGPLIGAIIEFGPTEATAQRYPAYEEWGLARLGKYVEHVDYLSIYQWLSGAFIRITLFLFIVRGLINAKSKKTNKWIVVTSSVVIVLFVALPLDEKLFFNLLIHIFLPMTFWFLFGVSLLLAIIAFITRRKQRGKKNVQTK